MNVYQVDVPLGRFALKPMDPPRGASQLSIAFSHLIDISSHGPELEVLGVWQDSSFGRLA